MGKEWMLDVLADLGTFADLNDLPDTAARIAEVLDTARREIADHSGGGPAWPSGVKGETGDVSARAGASYHA